MSAPTMLRPTDLKEVRDAVLDSAGTLAVAGAGTAARWAGALDPVDAVLDLGGLTGVITHNPGDMTVSVRAGTPLRALNAELAEHGQHVAFDAARVADGATVGGLVSTGDARPGRARARHPARPRDRHDAGARGRHRRAQRRARHQERRGLRPRQARPRRLRHARGDRRGRAAAAPAAAGRRRRSCCPCTLDEAAEHAARVLGGPSEPAALEWVSDPQGAQAREPGHATPSGTLLLRIEGTEAALPDRVARLRELLGPASAPDDGDAWAGHARLTRGTVDDTVLRIGVRPSRLPAVLAAMPARSVTAGLGTGVATVVLPPDPDAVAAAHAAVHAAGGTSVLRDRPAGVARGGVGSAALRARRAPGRQEVARPRRPARAGPVRPVASVGPDRRSAP